MCGTYKIKIFFKDKFIKKIDFSSNVIKLVKLKWSQLQVRKIWRSIFKVYF